MLLFVVGVLVVGGGVATVTRAIDGGPPEAPMSTAKPASRLEPPEAAGAAPQHPDAHDAPRLRAPPEEARGAGDPLDVARAFAEAWIDRNGDPAALEEQRRALVELSTGSWAREVHAAFEEAIGLGGDEGGSEGAVVLAEQTPVPGPSVAVLVVARERLISRGEPAEPFHYALYLARLDRIGGGYAVSSWEPQF